MNHQPDNDSAAGQTVLVVEDDVILRFLLADTLRNVGLQVIEAASGDDALAYLATHPITVVFSDVLLPGSMDGITLAEKIRGDYPEVKIILTSGDRDRQRAGEELNIPVIPKPYILARVIADIRSALTPEPT